MKHLFILTGLSVALSMGLIFSGCGPKEPYESVAGDPLQARIYTLDNGLKVYMSVNKDEPRIQTYIAVRAGGKNDPAETTGLAHYFEHLMFKGTTNFGTQNYEAEKPLLDEIERQFEIYRKTTDAAQRTAIYHVIDSLSFEASKYAIPNEYDKLMSAIGAKGTNAYTSYDKTVYIENIPSNQIENWAKVQADRFQNNVIRGFHTELETVYEEKNMSLTRDNRKVYEKLLASVFPHHPYGTQTILGTQDDLKNPSITNIKNFFKQWYVPNNMAICMSGDFDPDQTIAIIEKYFGSMKPNNNLPKLQFEDETPITQPISAEVFGLEAENVALAWRFPGYATKEAEIVNIVSQLLCNQQAGLFDININQQQKMMAAVSGVMEMSDYCMLLMYGYPKVGQTLDEAKDLILNELKKLREGNFDETMLEACINNLKMEYMQTLESNSGRANLFVNSFTNGSNWDDEVTKIDRLSKITKQDIVDFANKYITDQNYAIVYKRQGEDTSVKVVEKPQITPIAMNRDTASAFLREVQAAHVKPIDPVFLDYKKDLTFATTKAGNPVVYLQNTTNDIFKLRYIFEIGARNDKMLPVASIYMDYLGTADMLAEEFSSEFYRMACSFDFSVGTNRTTLEISGLSEYMPQAVALVEKLLAGAQVDKEAYDNMVADILKIRADNKARQNANFGNLMQYALYGPQNALTYIPGKQELEDLDPQVLIDKIHGLASFKHRITYYGPQPLDNLMATLAAVHKAPDVLADAPKGIEFELQQTQGTKIYLAPYDANQIYMLQTSFRGEDYDADIEPVRRLYNEYFGGGMNAIVFQEMRESRSLAYSAQALMNIYSPHPGQNKYAYSGVIATQNDKMMDAISAFDMIINDMPQSENAFALAKDGLIANMRTQRIMKDAIISSYLGALDRGDSTDIRRQVYDFVQNATIQDVVDFQHQWVKDRSYTYAILGKKSDLDIEALKKLGTVVELTTEDIFGY